VVKASQGTKRKRTARGLADNVGIASTSAGLSNDSEEDIILEEMGNTEDPEELLLADAQADDEIEASSEPNQPTADQITHDESLVKSLKDVAIAQMTVRGVTIGNGEAAEALKIIPKVCIQSSCRLI
jgi:hypothetical protein